MGFSTMILGFFFVFFDFNLGKINILPDLIGYLIIYFGASGVVGRMPNKYFSVLKKACGLLIALSGLDMIINYSSVLNGVINNPATIQGRVFLLLFTMTTISMLVYFFRNLTKGIEWEAEKAGEENLAAKARRVFKLVLIYQLIVGFFSIIAVFLTKQQNLTYSIDGVFGLFIIIAVLIVIIYIFVHVRSLLKQAEVTFRENMPAK